MKKFLLILFLIFCSISRANFSLHATEPNFSEKTKFSEGDIYADSAAIVLKNFKKNFKKKYQDADFVYEFKTPEKNAWDRFKEWLAGILKNIFSFSNNKTSLTIIEYFFKILIIAIIGFVVYLIVKSILNKDGKWIFGKNSDKKIIKYSDVEKNLQLIDFEKLIQKTLQSGEKRLSIRYYYLYLLKKMSANEIIVWDLEKTNSDYLYEIKNTGTREEFTYLSYIYNHIWYGEFEIDDETFNKAKTAFEKAINTLGNV